MTYARVARLSALSAHAMDFALSCLTPHALNIDEYIAEYSGHTRLRRLIHIASLCPALSSKALNIALNEVKKTINIALYKEIVQAINNVNISGYKKASIEIDQTWVVASEVQFKERLRKLEEARYIAHMHMASDDMMRVLVDFGLLYYECGDIGSAISFLFEGARKYW